LKLTHTILCVASFGILGKSVTLLEATGNSHSGMVVKLEEFFSVAVACPGQIWPVSRYTPILERDLRGGDNNLGPPLARCFWCQKERFGIF
jgi:hypothetical protein